MSDDSPQPRPRPQFGEYATPEEQRARIRNSGRQGPPSQAPAAAPGGPGVAPHASVPPWGPASAHPPAPSASQAAHPVDRVVTWALLAYGAVNVVLSIASFLDLAGVADMTYRVMGIPGSFTDTAAAHGWGIAAAIVLVLGYALTAWLALRTMRRGRRSWWIPVVGAVATTIVVSACVSVPLMTDPAFLDFLGRG